MMDLEQLSTERYRWQRGIPLLSREWWKANRDWADNEFPLIPLRRADSYDVIEAYRRAHTKRDPLLAPHGFFRKLPSKRTTAALEFVERFGPLDWPVTGEEPMFELYDFWLKHLRYVSVVRLWEERDSESGLRSALADLHKNIEDIHLAEGTEKLQDAPPHLGRFFMQGVVPLYPLGTVNAARICCPMPWERAQLSFEDWLSRTVFDELREAAIEIFHLELNLHLIGREARWYRMDKALYDPHLPVSFQLFVGVGNLWQRIWELTGLDTARVSSWRLCPACNVIFYPKRSDQYYCKSKEQILASKRNYARARRGRERLNKLLTMTEKPKTTER